jgi:DNA-directed RNA polymerase specialized sigma54-like protein
LKECLKIQIKPFDQREKTVLESLIDNHLEDLERKNYPVILKDLKISKGEALGVPAGRDPRPLPRPLPRPHVCQARTQRQVRSNRRDARSR